MQHNNIVLVGFMGTGKSTVGRFLAEKLSWELIDTDHYIEKQEEMSIAELFTKHGEVYFREIETRAIQSIMVKSNQVIATGGGAVLAEANRVCLKENGFVVALTASLETIIQRVGGDRNRPLLLGKAAEIVPQLLQKRKHAYDFADYTISTDRLRIEFIAQRLLVAYRKQTKG
ncbi:shikimate kinase [Paenibacillus psychroresistens]|nr:shikimate kinase [Paenibacillus psychroresistens]